jgi:hypothetical protein
MAAPSCKGQQQRHELTTHIARRIPQQGRWHVVLTDSATPEARTTCPTRAVGAPRPLLLPGTMTKAQAASVVTGAAARPAVRTSRGLPHRSSVASGATTMATASYRTGRARAAARRSRCRCRRCCWCWVPAGRREAAAVPAPAAAAQSPAAAAAALAPRCACSGGAGGRGPVPWASGRCCCGKEGGATATTTASADEANGDGGRPMGVAVRPEQRHHPLMPPPLLWDCARDAAADTMRRKEEEEKNVQRREGAFDIRCRQAKMYAYTTLHCNLSLLSPSAVGWSGEKVSCQGR